MSRDLVLELYSEEIPALMQLPAAKAFKDIFINNFTNSGIRFINLNTYVSPCRLTIYCENIANFVEPKTLERRGPKTIASEIAIKSFCDSCGKTLEELEIRKVKDVDYYFDIINVPEQPVEKLLSEIITKSIDEYVWPKSMHWGDYKISWIRPLKNIMCIFGDELFEFEYGHLKSNNITFGHKFMSPTAILVKNCKDYFVKLDENYILYDQDTRKAKIIKQIEEQSKELGVIVNIEAKLLEEVLGLVEYPNVMVGNIDKRFMNIPHEILTCSMRQHQKYFTARSSLGDFAPYFFFVSNMPRKSEKNIIAGNERVLSARLTDAEFFYNEDLKISCEDRYKKLGLVTFHARLGSMKDKADRMVNLLSGISDIASKEDLPIAFIAAKLCKTDLVSGVVGEFPELQGIIGGYYSNNDKLGEQVSKAITEHYRPYGANDDLPTTKISAYISIIDKLDSLVGLYIAGERATGSKDPYGLRRYALGIIRVIIDQELSYSIKKMVEKAVEIYSGNKDHVSEILYFIEERLKNYLSSDYDYKIVNAVISNSQLAKNGYDISKSYKKIIALSNFIVDQEIADQLFAVCKRMKNILKQNPVDVQKASTIFDPAEKKLSDEADIALSNAQPLLLSEDYGGYLKALTSLIKPLETFFTDITIVTEDISATQRRLVLLDQIYHCGFDSYCDFEEL